ncbi:hypothetical protein HanHA300_Chr15g0583411 [Helianthus annuus]|nr:hypothetical protein HanHA300_Chr15g0583411 [Helianthus annuus]KAJ0474739.1 hypothetical protein HanHA89_Chr15g0633201 [Helianthus annuus]KAJ0650293.1 hypothetical protein HanLR1_Chr15g0594101 [Helianthus annuus]
MYSPRGTQEFHSQISFCTTVGESEISDFMEDTANDPLAELLKDIFLTVSSNSATWRFRLSSLIFCFQSHSQALTTLVSFNRSTT